MRGAFPRAVALAAAADESGSGGQDHICDLQGEIERNAEAAEECSQRHGFLCFNICDRVYMLAPLVLALGLFSLGVEQVLERAKGLHPHIQVVMTNELAAAGSVSFLLFLIGNGQTQLVHTVAPEEESIHFRSFQEAIELTHMLLTHVAKGPCLRGESRCRESSCPGQRDEQGS